MQTWNFGPWSLAQLLSYVCKHHHSFVSYTTNKDQLELKLALNIYIVPPTYSNKQFRAAKLNQSSSFEPTRKTNALQCLIDDCAKCSHAQENEIKLRHLPFHAINFSTIIFEFIIDFWSPIASNYRVPNLKHQISRSLNLLSSKGACDARIHCGKTSPIFQNNYEFMCTQQQTQSEWASGRGGRGSESGGKKQPVYVRFNAKTHFGEHSKAIEQDRWQTDRTDINPSAVLTCAGSGFFVGSTHQITNVRSNN